MTVIAPEINPRTSVEKIVSPPANGIIPNSFDEWKDDEAPENDTLSNVPQRLDEETTFTATIKNTTDSISMVFSKNKTPNMKETSMANGSIMSGSGAKVVSRGRRRSVDKQYKPTQPTNSGGSRGSTRRSGRYQNYDNNSSNGNSGADGNGEDNDDSDDDDDDEYIDEDDDDEEEEEEEEEEDEEDDDNKNDEEEDDESLSGREKSTTGVDGINEQLLSSLSLKGPDDSSVVMMNSGSSETTLAPAPAGTPVNLQGVICHETIGGVLVVNIKWRNKIYCGSLMDCTRHSWARPRFQSSDNSNQGKTRLGKNNGRGKGKGRGKRLRSNSVTRDNANNHTVSPLKQKLRGRKKTISGSSNDKRTGFRSSKRKAKNNDDDSDDSTRPGKRSCTMKGAPSPQPSPTLIECPEPGCEKKYKHINGLRYHQAHAHLESKNQDDDANSDDRSSTTPSPSDDFKEPDPRTTVKARTSSRNRSESPSITQEKFKNNTNTDKEAISTETSTEPKNEPIRDKEPVNLWNAESEKKSDDNEVVDEKQKEESKHEENVENERKMLDENKEVGEKGEVCTEKTEESNMEGEFVEVADKSTDTRMTTSAESKMTSYPCEKHSGINIEMVLPASEVPEVADTQEVCVTVLDSGCISNNKYEESGAVNIDDVISSQSEAIDDSVKVERAERQDVVKESEAGSVFESKDDRRQIMLTTSSINQLGIEVEDISENEEDIDPGQDTEFNSREEMEKAVEGLQTGSFVASMSTENNLQMLTSLKDPSLIFGLTNRDKTSEESTAIDTTRPEDVFSVLSRNKQVNNEDDNQVSENSIDSEVEIATRPLLGLSGDNRDVNKSAEFVPSLSAKSEHESLEKSVSISSSSMSVENLVSRSISASKLQPPLTNTDTPSSRFKYFPCRSYGDEAYSQTASNMTNTNATTTLALIRDPELIKQESVSGNSANSVELHAPVINARTDPVASLVGNVGPSYTGSAGFDRECTTSSIHTRGPKEEHKVESSTGDIVRSTSYGSPGNLGVDKPRRNESSFNVSFSSPKSSITTTASTYNLLQNTPKSEESNDIKKDSNEESYNDSRVNLERESLNQSSDGDVSSAHSEGTGDEGKKDGDREKAASRMFPRQPPTLIPKHSRPTPPTLPVGVAHPYQYSTVATTAAVTTGLSVTSPGRPELCRPEPVRHNMPPKPDPEPVETKPPTLKKVVAEKSHPIPVGEVGPVAVKRPAIHAGLPTVIPVGAPALKGQGSLHTSIRQGLKPPGQEERSSTPGGLSSRLSGSPRPLPSSPRPLSTSPRPPLPKASTSETKPSSASLSSSVSSETSVKDDVTDNDVVILKTENEPHDKASSVEADKVKDRKRSPYHSSKEQLTPEKLQMYERQRQMYQAGIEFAYLQSLASPWHLNMSPEQMRILQQQHYRMRAEEESRELQASKNPKEDPNKLRMEKRETSSSPIGRRTTSEGRIPEQVVRSTPPRPERRLITGISPSSEASRSSTSDALNRGVQRLTQVEEPPEKKMRPEYSKSDDAERELQKLRHRKQEEYLSKQSMQHKFTMFKQLESAGGAAKTHSIPPLTSTNKDRLGERDDDFPKTKYTQRSPHGESLQPRTQETSRGANITDANSSDSSRSRDTNRDSIRETHLKSISKNTWPSSSSSRHSDTPPSERASSSSFRPTTQFQAYLQHNYDPVTGNPVLMQTPMGLMPSQLPMELGGVMNLSSTSVITSSTSTPTSVPSRLKEREHLSPYRGANTDLSPSSPHSRSSRSRSPSRDASPIPTSHSKSTFSRSNDRPRSPPSHVRSAYKTPDRTPSSSPSVTSRSSYRSVSPSSHLHRSAERMSNSSTILSRSSHRSSERPSSPPIHSHKESYRVPTSSPSRSSVFNRGERSASPPRSQSHNEYRFKQRSESSSSTMSSESLSKAKTAHDEPGYRGQERHDTEAAIQLRPGIISNNLAVRRGDVTPSMLMATPAQEEELIRRHQYMLYMQQQREHAAYAMMSSSQQNAPRSNPYYGKRQ